MGAGGRRLPLNGRGEGRAQGGRAKGDGVQRGTGTGATTGLAHLVRARHDIERIEEVKQGVEVIRHRNWNTKKVWVGGTLVATYRHQPKTLRFASRMVNDDNQGLAGGWWEGDIGDDEAEEAKIAKRVLAGLKPMGVLYFYPEDEGEPAGVAEGYKGRKNIDVKVIPVERGGTEVILARKGTLHELFDLGALYRDYEEASVVPTEVLQEQFKEYENWRLIDFAEGWDVEYVPPWGTGLILGYPVENTISLYRGAIS